MSRDAFYVSLQETENTYLVKLNKNQVDFLEQANLGFK